MNYDVGTDGQVNAIRINNSATALVSYEYDEFSRLRSIGRLNGVKTTLDFTGTGKLLNFNHDKINNANYEYNPAGQMVNRVTSCEDFQIKIPQPGKQEYATNALNQYESINDVALSYDPNGNLTGFDGWTYGYNAHNRLTTASTSGQSLSLEYDATGRLNSSTLNGTKTTFLYDGNELIAEYNAAGTLLKRYVHGVGSDDPLVSFDGSGTTSPTYLLADERGSIMAETNSAGTVTTKHQYGPYGEPINQSASRFRYTGQILLPGTALYHYKARVYHPKLGRFLQTDPIGYKDGMNWYAYVGNDPMNAVDPDGTCGTRIKGKTSVECSDYGVGSNLSKSSDSTSRSLGSYLPTLNQGFVDAVTGFGDGAYNAITLGFGDLSDIRTGLGIDGGFNNNSVHYSNGKLAGAINGGAALGGALGMIGKGKAGFEYSHFVPQRYLNNLGISRSWRTSVNGTYVPKLFHALTDKFRYRFMPRTFKAEFGTTSVIPQGIQQSLRVPPMYYGAGLGAISNDSN